MGDSAHFGILQKGTALFGDGGFKLYATGKSYALFGKNPHLQQSIAKRGI